MDDLRHSILVRGGEIMRLGRGMVLVKCELLSMVSPTQNRALTTEDDNYG